MNRLQSIDDDCPLFVTLNPVDEPAPDKVFAEFAYEHPLFDRGAVDAQVQLPQIQGRDRLWFCGAWCRYGFHEDGLTAGLAIAAQLGVADPFSQSSPQQQQAAE
jgi:predicted NAD/FAD-binding protein